MHKLYTLLTLTLFIGQTFASILPENNMAIPLSIKNEGLTEAQYHEVIDKVQETYEPIVRRLGRKLTIQRLWENPRVNAGTLRVGKEWILRMYGGYARHPQITEDAYALVLCHELGHHLGGAPRKYLGRSTPAWPSTEGQADYFATLKCLRKVFQKDDNLKVVSKMEVPRFVRKKCSISFEERWEKALCMRTTMAGIAASYISSDIRRAEIPSILTPDESVVEETYERHPVPQCRLDTYFQGSICEVSSFRSVSMYDEVKGTCHPENGHDTGTRPLCWFKPQENR